MKLTKDDKWLAVRWIDLQFAKREDFPAFEEDKKLQKTSARFKAWRAWRSLPVRWRDHKQWIEGNLSAAELSALESYVENIRSNS